MDRRNLGLAHAAVLSVYGAQDLPDHVTVGVIPGDTTAAHIMLTPDGSLIVAFPGTGHLGPEQSASGLHVEIRQWLRNLSFQQIDVTGRRVHRGFWTELDHLYPRIAECLKDHGGNVRPLLLTGHSAGAASATMLAKRLEDDGLAADGVYAFSSPRVGDQAFRDSVSTPVYRFECRDDLVPHLAPSPKVVKALNGLSVPLSDTLDEYLPQLQSRAALGQFAQTEYVHLGRLFFLDWQGNWLTSPTDLGSLLGVVMSNVNALPLPKTILDVGRFILTLRNVSDAARRCDSRIFLDHCIERAWGSAWSTLFANTNADTNADTSTNTGPGAAAGA
jgi:hypothetical protein